MQEEGYNGWANRETWLVGLYLDGNYDGEGTYVAVLELAESADQVFDLADGLKDFVGGSVGELDGIASDLLGCALGAVDWLELARVKLEEVGS